MPGAHGLMGLRHGNAGEAFGLPPGGMALLEVLVDGGRTASPLDLRRVEEDFRVLGLGDAGAAAEQLAQVGLLRADGGQVALDPARRHHVMAWLDEHRRKRELHLGPATVTWLELMDRFASYLGAGNQGTAAAGEGCDLPGSFRFRHGDRELVAITRLSLAMPDLLPAANTLVVTGLRGCEEAAAAIMARSASLVGRIGVYDLEAGLKMGVVRNPLFTLFEWFLRDEFCRRVAFSGYFTRALVRCGLLVLDR